jgi:hypothetical protein
MQCPQLVFREWHGADPWLHRVRNRANVAGRGSNSPVVAGLAAYQEELAYSPCLRAHGIPNYPDES